MDVKGCSPRFLTDDGAHGPGDERGGERLLLQELAAEPPGVLLKLGCGEGGGMSFCGGRLHRALCCSFF